METRMIAIRMTIALLFFATASMEIQAQEQSADTQKSAPILFLSGIVHDTSSLLLPSSLDDSLKYVPLSLYQVFMLPESYSSLSAKNTNMNIYAIWKDELASQKKYQVLKTLLMTVEAGGTAYLMYEHFQKYGVKGK